MQERPSDPSKMLSLEDGKYRKTGRGFSLRREDAMPKSAIEVSALIAEKKAINTTTVPEQTAPPPTRQAPTPPATPLPMYMSTNNPPGVVRREYCLFYNKYGECKKKNACLFVHDSRKIAICRGFLRGTCTDEECKLSHQLDPTKMPDCAPFLRGLCTREGCMYRHVNVSRDADVCDGFAKGYCALGLQCPLKHEFARANRSSNVKPTVASNETVKETRLDDVPADAATSTVVAPPALNIRPTIRFTPKVV
ncbi:hypothetical protein AeNC1_000160 [Aphanomyces euteiches]|nr:hypothetical protein AeNC1_000160 [Aphanomyces euteiches]